MANEPTDYAVQVAPVEQEAEGPDSKTWRVEGLEENVLQKCFEKSGVARYQALQTVFRTIDADESGIINLDELYDVMARSGFEITKAAAADILTNIDKDGSGDIDIDEFVEFFCHVADIKDFQEQVLVSEAKSSRRWFILGAYIACNLCAIFALVLFIDQNPDDFKLRLFLNICVATASFAIFYTIILPIIVMKTNPKKRWAEFKAARLERKNRKSAFQEAADRKEAEKKAAAEAAGALGQDDDPDVPPVGGMHGSYRIATCRHPTPFASSPEAAAAPSQKDALMIIACDDEEPVVQPLYHPDQYGQAASLFVGSNEHQAAPSVNSFVGAGERPCVQAWSPQKRPPRSRTK